MLCTIIKLLSIAVAVQSSRAETCASLCAFVPRSKKEGCEKRCDACSKEKDLKTCVNKKATTEFAKEILEGKKKGDQAKNSCMNEDDLEAKRKCFKDQGDTLPKPGKSDSENDKTKKFQNLREFQKIADGAEMEWKENKMRTKLFDKIKRNESNAVLERLKREMCADCINGTNWTSGASGIDDKYRRKVCVQKCVKKTLIDVESSDLKECYSNATTPQEKNACFCASKSDDDVREKIAKGGRVRKVKGVIEYICKTFRACAESDEVGCKQKLDAMVAMAKGRCTSGSEKFEATSKQIKEMCVRKQVESAADECKKALGKSRVGKEVNECIRSTTGLTKGKVKKLELKNLGKRSIDEMIACRSCKEESASAGSDEDCPDLSDCKALAKATLQQELGSACDGNYAALIGAANRLTLAVKDATGEDEEVDTPKMGCEIVATFKKGRGQCRTDGKMRDALKTKLANDGAKVSGIAGGADVDALQIERADGDSMIQEGTVTMKLDDNSSWAGMTEDEKQALIEEKCEELAASIQNDNDARRRLAELVGSDISEVAGTQATQTCAASDASCQTEELKGTGSSSSTGTGSTIESSLTSGSLGANQNAGLGYFLAVLLFAAISLSN